MRELQDREEEKTIEREQDSVPNPASSYKNEVIERQKESRISPAYERQEWLAKEERTKKLPPAIPVKSYSLHYGQQHDSTMSIHEPTVHEERPELRRSQQSVMVDE